MANYESLKTAIRNAVYENGNNEITGQGLQDVLEAIVNSLGAGYQFASVATTETEPGTPDTNVMYIAGAGTYPNFGGTVVPRGSVGVFRYNGEWIYSVIDVASWADASNKLYYNTQAGNVAAKTIQADGFTLQPGGWIKIHFDNANTVDNPTLNVNNTGAHTMTFNGRSVSATNSWKAGETVAFYYDNYGVGIWRGIRLVELPDFVNVNDSVGQSTPFASASAARTAIPQQNRKPGLNITYLLSTGENTSQWVQDMFIGDDVTDWSVADNWKTIGPVSVSQNIETGKTELLIGDTPALIVDNEPEVGSDNLVKSGGVAEKISQLGQETIIELPCLIFSGEVAASGSASDIKQVGISISQGEIIKCLYYYKSTVSRALIILFKNSTTQAEQVIYDYQNTTPENIESKIIVAESDFDTMIIYSVGKKVNIMLFRESVSSVGSEIIDILTKTGISTKEKQILTKIVRKQQAQYLDISRYGIGDIINIHYKINSSQDEFGFSIEWSDQTTTLLFDNEAPNFKSEDSINVSVVKSPSRLVIWNLCNDVDLEVYKIGKYSEVPMLSKIQEVEGYTLLNKKVWASQQQYLSPVFSIGTVYEDDEIMYVLTTQNAVLNNLGIELRNNGNNVISSGASFNVVEPTNFAVLYDKVTVSAGYGYGIVYIGNITADIPITIEVYRKCKDSIGAITDELKKDTAYPTQENLLLTDELAKSYYNSFKTKDIKGISLATRTPWTLAQLKELADSMADTGLNFINYMDSVKLDDTTFDYNGFTYNVVNFETSPSESDFKSFVEYCEGKGITVAMTETYYEHYPNQGETYWREPGYNTNRVINFDDPTPTTFFLEIYRKYITFAKSCGIKYFNIAMDEWGYRVDGYQELYEDGRFSYANFINNVVKIVIENGMIPCIWNGAPCVDQSSYPVFNKELEIFYYVADGGFLPEGESMGHVSTLVENGYKHLINASWDLYFSPHDNHKPTVNFIENFNIRQFFGNQISPILPDGVLLCCWPEPTTYDASRWLTELAPLIEALGERLNSQYTSNRPVNPNIGDSYFDEVLLQPIWWNGTNWVNSNGETV